jgi:hypothetical protein
MAKGKQRLSGVDFLTNLRSAGGSAMILTGMVKPAEDDEKAIMFARPGHCSDWVKIPADMVEHVDPHGPMACQGHTHHLASLHMKTPTSDEARTFASLVQLHRATASLGGQAPLHSAFLASPTGVGPCFCPNCAQPYFDMGTGQWRCP